MQFHATPPTSRHANLRPIPRRWARRPLFAVAIALAALWSTPRPAPASAIAGADTGTPNPNKNGEDLHPTEYNLIWQDEFEGLSLDRSRWEHRYPGARQQGVNVEEAATVDDGILTLRTWTETVDGAPVHKTGMIGTESTFQHAFGFWEARIDFDGQSGMWSAFWVQSSDIHDTTLPPEQAGVELDVVENHAFDRDGNFVGDKATMNTHWGGYESAHETRGTYTGDLGLSEGFHVYGLEWTPDSYAFYIDGEKVWDGADSPISQRAQYLILSNEVGLPNWVGPIPDGGFGSFDDTLARTKIDYVRVFGAAPIPEPASLATFAIGGLMLLRRKR